jgi:hypothetical protein
MWTDFLTQPQSVTHVFAGPPPSLSGLVLREVRFRPSEPGEEIAILLEWSSLPPGVPDKWHVKGYKALQLVLSFSAASSVVKHGSFIQRPVDVVVSKNCAVLLQPSTQASLKIESEQVFAKLHPYDGDSQHHGIRLG